MTDLRRFSRPRSLVARLVSSLIYIAAGSCLYLYLLNRILIQVRDGAHKKVLIRGAFAAVVGAWGLRGWFAAGPAAVAEPAVVFGAVCAGEVRRQVVRRQCRGSAPFAVTGTSLSVSRPFTTTDLAISRYSIAAPRWTGGRVRIAHLTDLHVNDHLSRAYYDDVMVRVAAEQPDLIFYTGDFVSRGRYTPLLAEVLSQLQAPLGAYGILGNHDYWAGSLPVKAAMRSAGIHLLSNGCRRVPAPGGGHILVCGCELPWSRRNWHLPVARDGDLTLALTHTPDNVHRLSGAGVTAIFAGHYHAGQIRVPGLGPLVIPSRYGRRFDHGHFVVDGTHLFVSAGVGASSPPYRIYCRPDVFIVDFHGGAAG